MISINKIFQAWANKFSENKDYLTELDSVAGDADLGLVMNDGFSKTNVFVAELSNETNVGMIFFKAGKYFNSVASSSMGTLLSAGLMNVGKSLNGKSEICDADLYTIINGIAEGVQHIGKAKEGEKTFLDAMIPAANAMKEGTINDAVIAAKNGVDKAKGMVAKHGRISFKGENSVGIIDPGTVVALLLVEGLKDATTDEK